MDDSISGWICFSVIYGSVCIRLHILDRPMGGHHEWLTAHALMTLEIWEKAGAQTYHFLPVYTYPNPADLHIKMWNMGAISDSAGNWYYISYPGFAFILPSVLFSVFQIPVTPLHLQLFNLLTHFPATLLLFLIIRNAISNRNQEIQVYSALVGSAMYLFSHVSLWYYSNVYFCDTLVQTLWLLSFWLWLRYQKQATTGNAVFFWLSLVLTCYTEWLGLFFAAIAGIYPLFESKFKKGWDFFVLSLTASGFALFFFFWHYSQINGWEALQTGLLEKFLSRSAIENPENQMGFFARKSWVYLIHYYRTLYLPVIILWIFCSGMAFVLLKERLLSILYASEKQILLLSFLPVLIHHSVFFNFTVVHDFSILKTAVPFCISSAIFLIILAEKLQETNQNEKVRWLLGFNLIVCMIGVVQYSNVNGKANFDYTFQTLGERIRSECSTSDLIALRTVGFEPYQGVEFPQINFYAKRNVFLYNDEAEVQNHLRKFGLKKAILYGIRPDCSVVFRKELLRN